VLGWKEVYGVRGKRGTEISAIMCSIFETAKASGVKPRKYLRKIVEAEIRNRNTLSLPATIVEILED
jgi:hypothetical protein